MRRLKEVLIITALSLGLLVLLEASVRLFGSEHTEMRPLAGESLAMADRVLGHRNRPDAVVQEVGPEFTALYAVDAYGMRVASGDTATVAALPDSLPVLLIGDSFTFGIGNDYEETWAHVFEKTLQAQGHAIRVVNAGVPGYDTRTEAGYLERLLPQVKPDRVVLTFLPNDLFTNRDIAAAASPSVVVAQDEKTPSLHILSLLQRLLAQNDWLYTRLYLQSARSPFFEQSPPAVVEAQLATTERLLAHIHRVCQEQGVPLMVLSVPQQFQVLVEARRYNVAGLNVHGIDERLAASARQAGYPWITALDTLVAIYRQENQDLYYRIDGHLTPEGNRIVGQVLADRFMDALRDHEACMVCSAASYR